MQDLPASRSHETSTNTHQRFSNPILSSFRSSHHTHKTPVLFRTTILFIFYKNCNFLISLCYLIAETSARSKQQILKTFVKLAEKADRQPVCIELKLKTMLTFYKCRVTVLVQRIFKTFVEIEAKILLIYCVIVGTNISKGNNYLVTYSNNNNAC